MDGVGNKLRNVLIPFNSDGDDSVAAGGFTLDGWLFCFID
jgi:hypothetical protein